MSRRRNSGRKGVRRRRAREAANEPLVGAAFVTLSLATCMSTSRASYETYLVTRSGVTQTLNEFMVGKYFGNYVFDALFNCNDTKIVSPMTCDGSSEMLFSFSEMLALVTINIIHRHRV